MQLLKKRAAIFDHLTILLISAVSEDPCWVDFLPSSLGEEGLDSAGMVEEPSSVVSLAM